MSMSRGIRCEDGVAGFELADIALVATREGVVELTRHLLSLFLVSKCCLVFYCYFPEFVYLYQSSGNMKSMERLRGKRNGNFKAEFICKIEYECIKIVIVACDIR